MSAPVPTTTPGRKRDTKIDGASRHTTTRGVQEEDEHDEIRGQHGCGQRRAGEGLAKHGQASLGTRGRDYIGYDPLVDACEPSRDARRARAARRGLLHPHLPASRDRPLGAGRTVRDDQGRHLGRASPAAALLHPVPRPARGDVLALHQGGRGRDARPGARLAPGDVAQCLGPLGRPFTLPAARDRSAAWSRAATASLPSSCSREELRARRSRRPRLLRRAQAQATFRSASASPASSPWSPATEDGSAGSARARHGAPRGLPRRRNRDR